ncbi:MAG TPA: hypothetical protein VN685_08815, partial [Rhizomicrobium sp.]|nr:hypothetical protein [Rhizomicrobium sp.]
SDILDAAILAQLPCCGKITWMSPLASDDYAEYRDEGFLTLLNLQHLQPALEQFWPKRGPQWDALGFSDHGDVLLVEAKAHVAELHSPASQAGAASLEKIKAALTEAAMRFGAPADASWHGKFYQLANRLAHLHWLRKHGVAAWLILINFIGDKEMRGPETSSEWEAAYHEAFAALAIAVDPPLLAHVLHIYLDVKNVR